MEAERRDHLVIDDEGAIAASSCAELLQVTGMWHYHAEVTDDGLDHNGRYIITPTRKRCLQCGDIIEWNRNDLLSDTCRNTSAIRDSER
ncbi:hypothetical protein D3C73_1149250 [compost metagenome]